MSLCSSLFFFFFFALYWGLRGTNSTISLRLRFFSLVHTHCTHTHSRTHTHTNTRTHTHPYQQSVITCLLGIPFERALFWHKFFYIIVILASVWHWVQDVISYIGIFIETSLPFSRSQHTHYTTHTRKHTHAHAHIPTHINSL